MGRPRVPLEERLWGRVDKTAPNGCWIYTGCTNHKGYGSIALGGSDGKRMSTHRLVYTLLVGAIPDGLVIDHLCRVRNCCNPAHLEPVTHLENVRRGVVRRFVIGEECLRGHVLSESSIYVQPNGNRTCRPCMRIRRREWYLKHEASTHCRVVRSGYGETR